MKSLCQSVCSPSPGSLSIWCTTLLGRTASPWLPKAWALLNSSKGWLWFWNSHSLLFLTAVCEAYGREVYLFWGWWVQLESSFENFWKVKLNLIRKALVTCTDTSNENNEHRWGALFQSQLGTWDQKKKKKSQENWGIYSSQGMEWEKKKKAWAEPSLQ